MRFICDLFILYTGIPFPFNGLSCTNIIFLMKKTILTLVIFFNLIPYFHNGSITIIGVEKCNAQDMGSVEEDSDGNFYFPIDDGPLPPGDGTEIQESRTMCAFEDMKMVSDYYGINGDMSADDFASWYSANYGIIYNDVVNVTGIAPDDFGSVLSSWFDVGVLSDQFDLMNSLQEGNMVMGVWDSGTGAGAHDVLIVSEDLDGNVEYWDPADGTYSQTTISDFNALIEVTPREDNPNNPQI
jgi:hypothetical protein